MSAPITDADLAELYEALGRPATHLRLVADDQLDGELCELRAAADELDTIWQALDKVPDATAGKHGEDCWKRHAGCLVEHLRGLVA